MKISPPISCSHPSPRIPCPAQSDLHQNFLPKHPSRLSPLWLPHPGLALPPQPRTMVGLLPKGEKGSLDRMSLSSPQKSHPVLPCFSDLYPTPLARFRLRGPGRQVGGVPQQSCQQREPPHSSEGYAIVQRRSKGLSCPLAWRKADFTADSYDPAEPPVPSSSCPLSFPGRSVS